MVVSASYTGAYWIEWSTLRRLPEQMIYPQIQSNLYEFDGNETRFPGTFSLPVRSDLYNIITEFYVIDMESSHNMILGRPWIHVMKAVSSSYHQLLRYRTPFGTTDIRGDQAMSRSITTIVQKKFGWTAKNARVTSNQGHSLRKKRNRSPLNSNHRAVETEKQAPSMRQRLQTIGRGRRRTGLCRPISSGTNSQNRGKSSGR